jgi:hypothetical protein
MTKHRTITGFVTVALLAVAATAAAMRSHLPRTDGIVVSGTTLLKGNANKFQTANFEDRWSALPALPPTTETAERSPGVH